MRSVALLVPHNNNTRTRTNPTPNTTLISGVRTAPDFSSSVLWRSFEVSIVIVMVVVVLLCFFLRVFVDERFFCDSFD